MNAPERFARWMCGHVANDKKFGRKVFRYHPRSDEHSKMICRLVLDDLLAACPAMAEHARSREIVGGTNVKYTFPNGKGKTLDLGVGTPAGAFPPLQLVEPEPILSGPIKGLRISCEAKQCMTEHGKTEPRIYDELSSSHEIVHQGDTNAIACGIVVVNIAANYASPTRQVSGDGPLVMTKHRQPTVTANMIDHLRGLKMREKPGEIGFDAFAVVVIDCDNTGDCRLQLGAPAPQPGDRDHYATFVERTSRAYAERFGGGRATATT